MRTLPANALLALAALVAPAAAGAVVVVRHPVYHPHAVVVVAPPPVVVAPPPTVVVTTTTLPAPAPPPPPMTTVLPINTTMWVLPSGCMQVSVDGQALYQCGPNWLKQLQSDKGPYYAVVPAPK